MRRNEVLAFLAISFTGAWLAVLPLWLNGFRRTSTDQGASPLAAVCLMAMMLVPALAAIALTVRHQGVRGTARVLGLSRALPWRREVTFTMVAVAVPLTLTAGGLALSTAAGWYSPGGAPEITPLLISAAVSIPLYFGEELGWQGYLLPRLLRFGTVRGLLLGGVIWGLWHAPMTALGGSYPGRPVWVAIPAAVVSAVLIGTVIAGVRLATGSVWAAVAAHLSLNEFALPLTTELSDRPVDPLLAGPLSLPTWVVTAVVLLCSVRVVRAVVSEQARHRAQPQAEQHLQPHVAQEPGHLGEQPQPVAAAGSAQREPGE
ncbi:membrane protease YdiL (CAAX protease family) [Herbihabitans rhizosphaerae]|uniref:Membrane protease YdiL (CAAX protease family) n=1 Tax=Herbihabitans rhizosphaerae TaxID=1872711 RepID=A0A4Q7L601_9PSEU|nr:membrane protease YdiL (CAAX protease family) [Herbihabitans rhizosphaerae]